MSAPWLSDQTRLLALVTGETYEAWMKRQFPRWPEKTWREEYGVPMDERNQIRKVNAR